MSLKHGWNLAWRNLARNRGRNFATGFAVALGFAGLILLGGYILRVERYLRVQTVYLLHMGHLAIYKHGGLDGFMVKPAKYGLTRAEQDAILKVAAADPNVEAVGKYLRGTGLIGNGCKTVPFLALGLTPESDHFARHHLAVKAAAPELAGLVRGKELAAYAADVDGALSLSTGLARILGKKNLRDELPPDAPVSIIEDCSAANVAEKLAADANVQLASGTYEGRFSARDGEVVSIFSTGAMELEDSSITTSLETLQQLYDTDQVTYIALFLKDSSRVQAAAGWFEQRLHEKGLNVSVFPYTNESLNQIYAGTMGFLKAMGAFIAVIVFSVVLLSILNSMTMTILERTREIGTFRSLGFTRRHMLLLFVREAMLLTGMGLFVGGVLANVIVWVVKTRNIRFSPPGVSGTIQLLITPNIELFAAVVVILATLALLATALAVRERTRRSVADLLTEVAT